MKYGLSPGKTIVIKSPEFQFGKTRIFSCVWDIFVSKLNFIYYSLVIMSLYLAMFYGTYLVLNLILAWGVL